MSKKSIKNVLLFALENDNAFCGHFSTEDKRTRRAFKDCCDLLSKNEVEFTASRVDLLIKLPNKTRIKFINITRRERLLGYRFDNLTRTEETKLKHLGEIPERLYE